MTGAIHFTGGDSIYRTDNDTGLTIYGGTDSNSGAYFQAFGKNSTYNSGVFNIVTSNGSNKIALRGAPNGDLTWNARNVVVVESWHSGTTWYRKYADGFIEQGGFDANTTSWVERNITLPTAFTTVNYSIFTQYTSTSIGSAVENSGASITNRTKTSFKLFNCSNTGAQVGTAWYACGY